MKKSMFMVLVLIIIIFLISVTIASSTEWFKIRSPANQREIYFGEDYVKPLGGFGRKGASRGDFGAAGYTSASTNLPYNDFISRGSDPSKISNSDPNMRGYSILDVMVELESVGGLVLQNSFVTKPKATARVVSSRPNLKDESRIYIQTRDLPFLTNDEIYEAWIIDEDTGYSRTIGVFRAPIVGSASLNFEINNHLYPYDLLVITKEPFPDEDPLPGEAVMVGVIPVTRKAFGSVSALAYTR